MNIFVPEEKEVTLDKSSLFVILRAFFIDGKVKNNKNQYNLDLKASNIRIVQEPSKADTIIIPLHINYYKNNNLMSLLEKYNSLCKKFNLLAFGFISGDFGRRFTEYSNIIYFRMSGFRRLLSDKNQGFPASLSDQLKILYKKENIRINKKPKVPRISFCGHATKNSFVFLYQTFKIFVENFKRFNGDPWGDNYEPFFQSAYHRYTILKKIEKSDGIKTNFIFRKNYRAGAKNDVQMKKTTLEYYDNILGSDYNLCLRGTGNFSIRLYETLMMGKIPIFVNTDCILPLDKIINWREHAIWIEWEDIENISDTIIHFHNKISDTDFEKIQKKNRDLWLEKLQPSWVLKNLIKLNNDNKNN